MYANGRGVVKNDVKAVELLRQAANNGHIIAKRKLNVDSDLDKSHLVLPEKQQPVFDEVDDVNTINNKKLIF